MTCRHPTNFDPEEKATQGHGMYTSSLAEHLRTLKKHMGREVDLYGYDDDGKLRLINQVYMSERGGEKVILITP